MVRVVHPDNFGWLEHQLNEHELNHINKCIEQGQTTDAKSQLIGHVNSSMNIKDMGRPSLEVSWT